MIIELVRVETFKLINGFERNSASLNPKGPTHPCVRRVNNGVQSLNRILKGNLVCQQCERSHSGSGLTEVESCVGVYMTLRWSSLVRCAQEPRSSLLPAKEEKSSKSPVATPSSSFSPVLTHELGKAENKRGESSRSAWSGPPASFRTIKSNVPHVSDCSPADL